ncbi:hypothetical protein FIV42_17650 [Persicimonas caeni]|uniref:Uncharacterized protein n=1 Tax=Persicimonas caeni TaxID=2292766 RepID=A0A4Y6PXM5_PERCE|nr:hypothetical protein [Persicimonas caeni]QDG52495.1 hypothetical protein FIV42_17650 [Persicimonas caeni]QED33717.1 hypothetical protein FRD00_17645 [Persicimonas caeni]
MKHAGWMMKLDALTSRTAAALTAILLLAGCSTEESLPQLDVDGTAAPDETRAGTLLAEYSHPRGAASGGVSVHAQFLDVHGVNYDTALEALEVWSPDWELDVDACSLRSDMAVGQQHPADIRLELLDVGPITVRGPGEAIRLEARRLPDLLSAFSGVIYGTEQGFGAQPLRIGYEPGAWYSFGAPGRSHTGGFYVSMRAPRPIRIAAIGDLPADQGRQLDADFTQDLTVEWQPSFGEASDDTVFLYISSGFGPDRPRLTCRVDDDGSFTVPDTIVQQLSQDSAELELTLRRITSERVDIDELETSEFIFSTVDEITLVGQ